MGRVASAAAAAAPSRIAHAVMRVASHIMPLCRSASSSSRGIPWIFVGSIGCRKSPQLEREMSERSVDEVIVWHLFEMEGLTRVVPEFNVPESCPAQVPSNGYRYP